MSTKKENNDTVKAELSHQELASLYYASLQDEDFQQQVKKSLRSLSQEAQVALRDTEQVFLQDEKLPLPVRDTLVDLINTKNESLVTSSSHSGMNSKQLKTQISWWAGIFQGWGNSFLLKPVVALPVMLMIGGVLGMLLPSLLNFQQTSIKVRGGEAVIPVDMTQEGRIEESLTSPTHFISTKLKENPKQWMAAIISLLRKGDVVLAREQLQEFSIRYPHYKPQ